MKLFKRILRKIQREYLKILNKIKFSLNERRLIKNGIKLSPKERLKNSQKPPIKLYWYQNKENNIYNFGDEFSAVVINKLTGYNVEYTPYKECDTVAVGSLMELMANHPTDTRVKVWGSGFIKEDGRSEAQNAEILAVRGILTKERLGLDYDVPMGDPGILANACFPQIPRKETGKIGFIAHYVDANHPIVAKIKQDKRFMLINPLTPPENVAKQISGCKYVISSSLHGLIFADSFSIPNAHITLSSKVKGGDYKFRDYCSGVGKEYITVSKEDIFDMEGLASILEKYKPIENITKLQRNLISAFINNID